MPVSNVSSSLSEKPCNAIAKGEDKAALSPANIYVAFSCFLLITMIVFLV